MQPLLSRLRALGGLRERLSHDLEATLGNRDEEVGLGREEPEQVRVRDAGLLCDLLRWRAVQAPPGEPLGCHLHHDLAALVGADAGAPLSLLGLGGSGNREVS